MSAGASWCEHRHWSTDQNAAADANQTVGAVHNRTLTVACQMRRLQSVLNAAAWLIFNLKCSNHITDALVSLHWLRVPERIQYKIAVLGYKVLHDTAPRYLGPLTRVADIPGRRALCSASTNCLDVPQTFHHQRLIFSGCRLTDLELTTRHSRFSINTAVVQTPTENFLISTILYSLAL